MSQASAPTYVQVYPNLGRPPRKEIRDEKGRPKKKKNDNNKNNK